MSDSLRDKIAVVAQHCREHRPEHECVCSMPPTDWDYELADAVIRELALREETCVMANHADHDRRVAYTKVPLHRYVTEWETTE